MLQQCVFVLALLVLVTSSLADDLDRDGLDDQQIEQMLLMRHRPILKFMQGERYVPVSVLDFVRHSSLQAWYRSIPQTGCSLGQCGVFTEDQVASNPPLILNGGTPGCVPPVLCYPLDGTSFASDPSPIVRWRLNVNDSYRAPFSSGPTFYNGIYGHVTPVDGNLLLVQYWLLLPMNEAECMSDCGDHEGDWLYLDVYVSEQAPFPLQYIVYHHHGDNNCAPVYVPYFGGPPYNQPPVLLPTDGHPICYIEEQAHEWWPWASGGGECEFAPGCENASHMGNGLTYMVQSVTNVGEWYSPMPGSLEAQLFVLFNGLWGSWGADCEPFNTATPPDSPMVQFFPHPSNWTFLSHGHVNTVGDGSATNPWRTFPLAVASTQAGKKIRIIAGDYTAVGTWSTPITLTATLGSVTLGD